jgi:hypothetical protein
MCTISSKAVVSADKHRHVVEDIHGGEVEVRKGKFRHRKVGTSECLGYYDDKIAGGPSNIYHERDVLMMESMS